jgi:hypothetical protein
MFNSPCRTVRDSHSASICNRFAYAFSTHPKKTLFSATAAAGMSHIIALVVDAIKRLVRTTSANSRGNAM